MSAQPILDGVLGVNKAKVDANNALVVTLSGVTVSQSPSMSIIDGVSGVNKAKVNAAGALSVDVGGGGAATGTQTSIAAVSADATILAANTNRIGAYIYNESTSVLYLLEASAVASNINYSFQMAAGSLYIQDFGYTGVIKGIWATTANGNARVTELTP